MDQANTLRHLLGARHQAISPIISDATGMAGSLVAGYFAEALARSGLSSVVLDGAKQGIAHDRGLRVKFELAHVLAGDVNLEDVCLNAGSRQWVVPSYRGFQSMQQSLYLAQAFAQHLHRLPVTADVILASIPTQAIDAAIELSQPDSDWFWVVAPKAQSVTAVYSGLKHVANRYPDVQHRLIVAGTSDYHEADHVFANLVDASRRFLHLPLEYAGFMPATKTPEQRHAGKRVATAMMTRVGLGVMAY